jgi:hypothetical protein
MFGLTLFSAQVVRALVQMATNTLPGMGADGVLGQLRQILQQKQVEKAIAGAVESGCAAFIKDEQHGEAAALLRTLERRGLFKKHSPIIPALAALAMDPTHSATMVEHEIVAHMQASVPESSALQCERLARGLIAQVRTKVDAIPQMREVQKLVYQRLTHQAMVELLKKFNPPLPEALRKELLHDAGDAVTRLRHARLTSAHLLYALTRRKASAARHALARVGITTARAWEALANILATADHTNLHPTRSVERALSAARSVAAHYEAGTAHEAHVLEALLDVTENDEEHGESVRRMLAYLHTTFPAIRQALHDEIGENDSFNDHTPPPPRPPHISEIPTLQEGADEE